MRERSELYKIEEEMALKAEAPSCTPGNMAKEILGIEAVQGLTVVDLASGTSSLVATLISEGADAHAVDIVYGKSVDELDNEASDLLLRMAQMAPYGYGQKFMEQGLASIQAFTNSYRDNPERYHKAYLTRLPFENDSVDVTTSLNGITALSQDVDMTIERIKEAIRITKPGGKIILAPIHSEDDPDFDYFADQHAEVFIALQEEGYDIRIQQGITVTSDLPFPTFTRAVITKKAS
jgi:SAM-dependent methyltransferase